MKKLNIIIPSHIKRIFCRGGVCPLPSLFKFTFLLLFMMTLTGITQSQSEQIHFGEVWKNYTNNRWVNWLALEGDYLWQGTSGGVVKRSITNPLTDVIYYTKENSGLISLNISSIAIDKSGNKWFGTWDRGVSKFDGTNWTSYTTYNSGLVGNSILSIAIDSSGNVWFGTQFNGVSKFDGSNWTTYNPSNSGLANDTIMFILADGSGDIWCATLWTWVSKFDGTKWETYITSNSGLPDNSIYSIGIEKTGVKWFGTWQNGVCRFDGINWETYDSSNSELANNQVFDITIDDSANKWFGTGGGGVSKFDGINWTTYDTSSSGLVSDWLNCITIDREGNKWFGTVMGVSKFDGINWINYDRSNSGLVDDDISSIAQDSSGHMWFASGSWVGGVYEFDDTNWVTYNTSNSGLTDNHVNAVVVDASNNKWFGTEGGVCKYDGTNWTTYTKSNSGIDSGDVMDIDFDHSGNVWIATVPVCFLDPFGFTYCFGGGVSKFNGTNWTIYNTWNSGLPGDYVHAIAIDGSGNKWFATGGGVGYLGLPTSVPEEPVQPNVPNSFELCQNYPNPFNPNTTISFTVYGSQFIVHSPINTTLKIYNIRGQLVRTLVDDEKLPGYYQVFWDGKDNSGKEVASGIYFYQLKTRDYSDTRKMILLR